MYTKSAFPTRLSFTSETSFTSSFPYIPKVCTAFSLSDTRDIFPLLFYFPLFSILTVSKFSLLPQYLVYSSVPHVCFTYQQNTKDSFVYYHENFFLPISLDLLQNTIYILLPFSSCPFQKDVNAIFQISPPMPLINCPVSYYSAYHLFFFFNYVLIFHIQKFSARVSQSSPLSFLFNRFFHLHLCCIKLCKRVFNFV